LKQCQAHLERARPRAKAIDRAKSRFLKSVRHEVRILNRIMGFDHQLELTDRQREYSKLIQASSISLLSLIDDVHDLKNIAKRTMEIEALPFRLNVFAKSPERTPAVRRASVPAGVPLAATTGSSCEDQSFWRKRESRVMKRKLGYRGGHYAHARRRRRSYS
jgi:hypothetical protein